MAGLMSRREALAFSTAGLSLAAVPWPALAADADLWVDELASRFMTRFEVPGAAIAIGCRALRDEAWAEATSTRLAKDCVRLDDMARTQGWRLVGGTPLFRLYETHDALAAQEKLARAQIWSRVFAREPTWLRLGLPGSEAEWSRLAEVLAR